MQFKTTANFVCALYQHCVSKPAIFLAFSDPLLRIQDDSNIIQFHFSDCLAFTQKQTAEYTDTTTTSSLYLTIIKSTNR